METTPFSSFEDESPLTAAIDDLQRQSIDNRTLFDTPAPLAASTVARPQGQRHLHVQGSFLEDSSTVASPGLDENRQTIKMSSFGEQTSSVCGASGLEMHNNKQNISRQSTGDTLNQMNRSSLGILPIDNMEELSSCILHLDPSPEKHKVKVPGSHGSLQREVIHELSDEVEHMDNSGTSKADMLPMYYSTSGNDRQNQNLVLNSLPSKVDPSSMRQYMISPCQQSAHFSPSDLLKQPTEQTGSGLEPFNLAGVNDEPKPPLIQVKNPSQNVQDEVGFDVCGGKPMNVLAAVGSGLMFGSDPDASVQEIRLEDNELEQFDDEFSDIGEFDNTVTDEMSPSEGRRSEGESFFPNQPSNLFETSHPFIVEGDSLFLHESQTQGMDEIDVLKKKNKPGSNFESQQQPYHSKVTSFSLLQGQQNFEDFQHSEFQDLMGNCNNSNIDKMAKKYSLPQFQHMQENPGFERDANQGEGQEEETNHSLRVSNLPPELDSKYFRHSPSGTMNPVDEEESISEDSMFAPNRSSLMFDSGHVDQRDSGVSTDHLVAMEADSQNSSEIDTEDEVEAVRREMRATYMKGEDEDCPDDKPDFEGYDQPLGQENIRQSAEGIVEPPLAPGDGDGRESDDMQAVMAQHFQMQQQQPANSSSRPGNAMTTFQFLQGLGILSGHNSPREMEGSSRNHSRVNPMGDEDDGNNLTSSQERRVRFASPELRERDRTLSGASTGYDDSSQVKMDDGSNSMMILKTGELSGATLPDTEVNQESHLGSKFFNPSGQSASCIANDSSSPSWGLEHSTFNLGDLVPTDAETRTDGLRQVVPGSDEVCSEREEPEVDKEFQDKFTGEGNDVSQTGKTYLCDDSPVYINEKGEGVTDLAYQVSFSEVAQNPFDGGPALQDGISGMFDGGLQSSDFNNAGEVDFGSGEFVSSEQGLAMIDHDEEEFQKENIFIQDETMGENNTYLHNQSNHHLGGTGASSLGLPDSWSFHTHMDNLSRPSWLSDTMDSNAAYHRISIGAFMMARTEALGSLDGNYNSQRPAFGTHIVTPPSDRKPVALYQKTSPSYSLLGSVDEGGSFIDRDEDVRGAGVGSDSESDREVRDIVVSEQQEGYHQKKDKTQHMQSDQEQVIRPKSQEERLSELLELGRLGSNSGSSTPDQNMANITGALDLSDITRLITTASASAKPKELTEMILRLSQNKKIMKYTNERNTPNIESQKPLQNGMDSQYSHDSQTPNPDSQQSQPQVIEAHFNGRPVTPSQMTVQRSEFHTEIPDNRKQQPLPNGKTYTASNGKVLPTSSEQQHSAYGRIPADGKSEKGTNGSVGIASNVTKQQESAPLNQGVMSSRVPLLTQKNTELSSQRAGKDRDTLTNSRDSRSSGSRDRNTLTNSKVPSSSSKQPGKRGSGIVEGASRRSTVSSDGSSRGSDKNNNLPLQMTKQDLASVNQNQNKAVEKPKPKQSNVSQHMTNGRKSLDTKKKSTTRSDNKKVNVAKGKVAANNQEKKLSNQVHRAPSPQMQRNDVSESPSTPKHLVLREKDFHSESPNVRKEFSSVTHFSDNDIVWRSPRPSSVLSRSSRHDGSFDSDTSFNQYPRHLEPDGAHHDIPQTPPTVKPVIVNRNSDTMMRNNEREIPGIDNDQQQKQAAGKMGKRLSSTPVREDQMGITLGTQDTFSQIVGLSPNRRLYDDSNDNTLISDEHDYGNRDSPKTDHNGGSYQTSVQLDDPQQSTPKTCKNERYSELPQTNSVKSKGSPHYYSQQQDQMTDINQLSPKAVLSQMTNQIPKTTPTLLTNQPLSRTAFANQYLSNQSHKVFDAAYEPQSWKSATVPVNQLQSNSDGKLSTGSVTSFTGADVHITVAPELRIPEVCCVGLSTHGTLHLQNPTSRWLHVALKLVSLSMDGQSTDMTRMMPFVMKEKVIVEPKSSEDVKVIFAPRQAGVYVGQLHVISSPVVSDHPLQLNKLPAMVSLQALAEKPHVQILTADNNRMLEFGSIPWGCHKGVPVTLVNKGRASVPVRLVISSHKSHGYHANCFTFERYTTGDTSLISNKMRPSIPSMSPCVVNYTLPGTNEDTGDFKPLEVMVFFVAPCKQIERGSISSPEEFIAKLDVEVDTPSSLMNLSSVVLRSVVGTARLHAPSSDLDQVCLKADMGKFQTHVVPLRNAGNIPIEVSLEVTHFRESFGTIPMQLMIEPGGQSEVTIKFQPKDCTPKKLESLLILLIEPDGPSYEIPLIGEISVSQSFGQHSSQIQSFKSTSRGPQLLSNKHFLSWSGVPLGRARQQSLTLKNVAEHMLKLRLEIRATHENFQIQSLYGNKERLSISKEIIMKPLEQYPVHVLFAPTKVASRDAKLVIRVVNNSTKYTIPLSGYGGISKLVMEGVQPGQNSNYWLGVGTPESGQSIVAKAVIRNVGNRAAYVNCVGFHDLRCKKRMIETRISFQPDEFCIKEKQSQQITVIFHPNDKDVLMCQGKASILTSVACFYGDEVSRQQLRRAVQKYGTRCLSKCPEDSPVKDIKFHTPFEGEDLVCEGEAVKDSPNDVDLFYSTMSKMMLALVSEPQTTSNVHNLKTIIQPNIPVNVRTSGGGAFSQDIIMQQQQQKLVKAQERLNSLPPASWDSSGDKLSEKLKCTSEEDIYNTPTPSNNKTSQGKPHQQKSPSQSSPPERDINAHMPKITASNNVGITDTQSIAYSGTGSVYPSSAVGESCVIGKGFGVATEWTVHPQQLVLPAPSKSANPLVKSAQLFNFTERPMNFELSWPAHCITVTPEQGLVAPKKSAVLNISANVLLKSKGVPLPWSGNVHITCNGQTMVLKVQIRESTVNEDALHHVSPENLNSWSQSNQKGAPLVSVITPLPSRKQGGNTIKEVGFVSTHLGKTAETEMEITNITGQPVKWLVSSFTPPYLKSRDGDQSVVRVTYSTFWLPRQTGLLRPGDTTKVQVCFQPRELGQYSQHWELKSEVQASIIEASYCTKLEFYGEGFEEGNQNKNNFLHGSAWTDGRLSPKFSRGGERHEKSNDDAIELRQERIIFPDTARRETHQCKLELKNGAKKVHKVVIVAPQAPFHVRHCVVTLKSRHFVRLPIEFAPKKPGHYQAELILKSDTGRILTVPLIGRCPDSNSSKC